jgi:hypothetical protein
MGAADPPLEIEIVVRDGVDEMLPELADVDLIHRFPPNCGCMGAAPDSRVENQLIPCIKTSQ